MRKRVKRNTEEILREKSPEEEQTLEIFLRGKTMNFECAITSKRRI